MTPRSRTTSSLLRGLSVAAAFCGFASAAPAQPLDAATLPRAAAATFMLRAAGRCLEVNEAQLTVDGARVQAGRCEGRPNQAWRHDRGLIVNVANGRCLDLHGPDVGTDGARVQTVACGPAPSQQWRLERGQLLSRGDDRCLEVLGVESPRSPALVQSWRCTGEPPQRWRMAALPTGAGTGPATPPPPAAPAPAASARDVEAGPLFNNAEAAQKCPAVCAPGRWSGRWVTTVPGRMSVCGCVYEVPASPPGPASPPPSANEPMAAASFTELVRQLDEEAFAANALRTLQLVVRDHRFSVEQVARLLQIFPFSNDRLKALELTVPRLTDRENSFQLLSAFVFARDREEAQRILQSSGR